MPHYGDPIREVGKHIKQTRQNTDAALRRAYPVVPKIERTRDIFDSIQPFEMTFETDREGLGVEVDLFFNKPPPQCAISTFKKCCEEFIESPGPHLLQLANAYVPGHIQITINGFDITLFDERDPEDGLVYILGTSADPQYIYICYLRELP